MRRSTARFKVVACGRQWGKTYLGCPYALNRALEGKDVWWVAPDYPRAQIGWRLIKRLARQLPGLAEVREAERRIEFTNGAFIEVKSAHGEDRLRGPTLDCVVVDEAAFMPGERWHKELRATLAVRKGEALFLSTFDGENWFYDIYQRGQREDQPDWQSWRHASVENPWIDDEEVEEARRNTEKAVFEQEWEANPLVYVGAVFDGALLQRASERPLRGGTAWAGLDWGYTNPTVLLVCEEDVEGRVSWVHERAWQAVELNKRCAEIAAIAKEYGVERIYADAAGASENRTLAMHLQSAGAKADVQGVPFGKYKKDGIQTRRYYLERGLEAIGPGCPELRRTSKRYRYKEGSDDVVKDDDHYQDAATAFYGSRRGALLGKRSA